MGGKDTINPKLSIGEIEQLKNKGYNQSEIAEMYGKTRAAVSWHKRTYGGHMTPRETVNEEWPWETTHAHGKAAPYKRLRDHAEYMVTSGKGMSEDKLKRLRTFYKRMRDEDLVIEFDPNLPPEPGVSPNGGFAYRKREMSDDDLLIRVNEYTRLSELGETIWCFPPEDP